MSETTARKCIHKFVQLCFQFWGKTNKSWIRTSKILGKLKIHNYLTQKSRISTWQQKSAIPINTYMHIQFSIPSTFIADVQTMAVA